MQKVKPFFLILSIFFITKNGSSQAIELLGKFRNGNEIIEFVAKDSFYYSIRPNCEEFFYGKGTCVVKNNFLYLNFGNTDEPFAFNFKPNIIRTKNIDDTSRLSFSCKSDNGEDLNNVRLSVKGRKFGTHTNLEGEAILKIKNIFFPLIINASIIGMNSKEIKLDSAGSYDVKLIFTTNNSFVKAINKGEQYVYDIEALEEDYIKMKQKNSAGSFNTFKKRNN